MSATLDAQPVADLMGAPVVTAEGRAFPVDLRWLPRPLGDTRIETATAAAIREALEQTDGDILAFLPGEAEIRRTRVAPRRTSTASPSAPSTPPSPPPRSALALEPAADAQGRPRHLHRRDLADDPRRPRRGGRRPRPALPLRPRLRHVRPRDRAGHPGRGHPARRAAPAASPRAPAGASGRAARRAASSPFPRPRSSPPTSLPWRSTSPSGAATTSPS